MTSPSLPGQSSLMDQTRKYFKSLWTSKLSQTGLSLPPHHSWPQVYATILDSPIWLRTEILAQFTKSKCYEQVKVDGALCKSTGMLFPLIHIISSFIHFLAVFICFLVFMRVLMFISSFGKLLSQSAPSTLLLICHIDPNSQFFYGCQQFSLFNTRCRSNITCQGSQPQFSEKF